MGEFLFVDLPTTLPRSVLMIRKAGIRMYTSSSPTLVYPREIGVSINFISFDTTWLLY